MVVSRESEGTEVKAPPGSERPFSDVEGWIVAWEEMGRLTEPYSHDIRDRTLDIVGGQGDGRPET